jgi:hypothetical protein
MTHPDWTTNPMTGGTDLVAAPDRPSDALRRA